MNIGMILQQPFPPDMRVEKEALSLIGGGHRVYLLCAGHGVESPTQNWKDIQIRRVPSLATLANRCNNLVYKVCFVDLLWLGWIHRFVLKNSVQVLHVHDLPLVRTALVVAGCLKIPVIFDMHERWPEAVESWVGKHSLWERLSTHSYHRLVFLEKQCVQACHRIICISDTHALDLCRIHHIPQDKIVLVPNYVDLAAFSTCPADRSDDANWNILYIGTVEPHRGIDTLIKSLLFILPSIPNARLRIGGRVRPEIQMWLNGSMPPTTGEHVDLLGYVDSSDIYSHLSSCEVVVNPLVANTGRFDGSNKNFQAMIAGRPIVVSDVGDYKAKVEKLRCGLVVPPGDPRALAEAIISLYRDPDMARRLGENGRGAVVEKYNWDIAAKELLALYSRLETEQGNACL